MHKGGKITVVSINAQADIESRNGSEDNLTRSQTGMGKIRVRTNVAIERDAKIKDRSRLDV